MAVNRNTTKNLALAGGEVFIKRAGESEFEYFGTSKEYKYSFETETIEHTNSEGNSIVTDLEVTKSKKATVNLTTEDLNKSVIAMAFGGDVIDVAQASGSVTDKEFTAVKASKVYDLGKVEVSNVVVTWDDDGTDTESIENVDYSIDYKFGTIEIAEDGVLVGKDIKVDYDFAKTTISTYGTLNKTSDEVSLKFVGKPQHGKHTETIAHRVKLTMNGDYNLKSLEDFMSLTFSGKILEDASRVNGQNFVSTRSLENN